MTTRNQATELRAKPGDDHMEIDWADGHTSRYPHRLLRGFCPCAGCQGHQGPIRFHDAGSPGISDIEEMGHYALQLRFDDGHGTGLYSFKFLRALCPCRICIGDSPADNRTFTRA